MPAMSLRRVALLLLVACGAPPTPPVETAAARRVSRTQQSRALFAEMAKVLMHPRCVNCHTPDESPRQGDASALHDPPVVRGTGDRGIVGMQCTGCHQDRNAELARVPGAPGWHLAPVSMVWLDRTPHEICEQLKDRRRNGDRSLTDLHDHLAKDRLVAWGWDPGADRTPVPGTQAQLGELAAAWIDSGAECPEETPR
jgi:hypothetical protein